MSINFSRYTEKSRCDRGTYTYIVADYNSEPTCCIDKNCESIYFRPWDPKMQYHKLFTVVEGKPAVIDAYRPRYRCKWCNKTFAADQEETYGWTTDIDPEFRNIVISDWIKTPLASVAEIAKKYGIDELSFR